MAEEANVKRITRRGTQIFQLAMAMEDGGTGDGSGAEALFYLTDAIARIAALSVKPQLAVEVAVGMLDKIDSAWLEKNHERRAPEDNIVASLALEIGLGPDDPHEAPGEAPARALGQLADAVVYVAALNSDPRRIIEHVVQRLDATDVDAVRKEHLR